MVKVSLVDNTNPGADTRADYIALAKSHKIPCRCFVLNTPIELCHHLNYVRVHQTSGDVRRIPGILKNKARFFLSISFDLFYYRCWL